MLPNETNKRDVHRPRLFLYGEKFPEKLYSVVQDGFLLSWDGNGEKINVGASPLSHSSGRWKKSDGVERFEDLVMDLYPGFVQIPQFANLRRLFREYSFNWHLSSSGHFTFGHPCFIRGRTELLSKIKTRRKSLPLSDGFRRNTRRRSLKMSTSSGGGLKKDQNAGENNNNYDHDDINNTKGDKSSESLKRMRQSFLLRNDNFLLNDEEGERSPSPCRIDKDQLKNILKSFLKNELELEENKILHVDWSCCSSSSQNCGVYEDKTTNEPLTFNNVPSICIPDGEESSDQNLEDYYFIENENTDCLFEWTRGPQGYLRPILNSEGVITRIYYPL